MKRLIFLLVAIASAIGVLGQEMKPDFKPYFFWVLTDTTDETFKGVLYAVTDTSIILRTTQTSDLPFSSYSAMLTEIDYSNIKVIKYRRKGSVLTGAGFGLGAGVVVGGWTGFSSGDDDSGWFSQPRKRQSY